MKEPGSFNVARRVLRIELLQLARDKRALFSSIVLPALLYPLLFLGMGKLEDVGRETMEKRSVTILADLAAMPEATRAEVIAKLEDAGPVEIRDVEARTTLDAAEDALAERLAARELMELDGPPPANPTDRIDLLAVAEPLGGEAGRERTSIDLWYVVKSDDAREARSRMRSALRDVEGVEIDQRRELLLGGDPARALDSDVRDLATEEESSGAALGKLLPFIIMLVLVSGGAYAALAVFAGEREAGTLETLLVQPVPSSAVAWGKFATVFVAGLATLAANLASLGACIGFGLVQDGALGGGEGGISLMRFAVTLIELPACLLLCAVLCLVCGGARTFREGQLLIFPVTLMVAVPTMIVVAPEAELTALWAMIPFAGSALALRDGLEGSLSVPLGALVVASHLGWTWLALQRVGRILDAEKVLGGGDAAAEADLRKASGRHAMRWGFATVMLVYLVAGAVQRQDLIPGLVFTFWMLLPAIAIGVVLTAPKRDGARPSFAQSLGLRMPHPAHVVGALLVVPALTRGAMALADWQRKVLPLPPGAEQAMENMGDLFEMSPFMLFFFLALSPGIFEELVFRGALLEQMKRDWKVGKIVAWQAIYFALVHSSIYRLLPTAILGALLSLLALRAKSVVPAILLHIAYNGLLILGQTGELAFVDAAWFPWFTWIGLPIGLVLLVAARPARTD